MGRTVTFTPITGPECSNGSPGEADLGHFAHDTRLVAVVREEPGDIVVDIIMGYVCSGPDKSRLFLPDVALPRGDKYQTGHPMPPVLLAQWAGHTATRRLAAGSCRG